ncbi:MAG: ComEA family DNA-binding protein [Acidaminococcales bacterium]|nr:ComEA family DNA-binding protein [Acidaminococcales bacterium]
MEKEEKYKLAAIMLLLALFTGAGVWRQERRLSVAGSPPETPPTVYEALKKQQITVSVAGAVASPGLYDLSPGSRAADAISKAGGFLPQADRDKVNLARRCSDGMNILVPYKKAEPPEKRPRRARTDVPPPGETIDINSAGEDEFSRLPGIGPELAKRIVAYRARYGPFKTTGQLKDVDGIGEAKFSLFRNRLKI